MAAARKLRERIDRKDNADKMRLKRSTDFERYVQEERESAQASAMERCRLKLSERRAGAHTEGSPLD